MIFQLLWRKSPLNIPQQYWEFQWFCLALWNLTPSRLIKKMYRNLSVYYLKPLNGIQRKFKGSKISTSSTNFVFFGPIGNVRWPPGLWLAETFSTSLKLMNGIQRKLTGSKISRSSTEFVFFGTIGKTRWPPWPLIGWDIFYFSETTERNSTKLDRKQDLNVLYQVCVFKTDRKKTRWPPWPLIGWGILDISEIAERNSTKLDRKKDLKVLYQVCVFRDDRKKQDGRPGLWLAETFSTSLKLLNGIQRNLTGSKVTTSSTNCKFVLLGPIGKTRWPPGPLIGWYIFDIS